MNIHEFQAKQLFAQFGIPVPKGKEVRTTGAAEKWAGKLETPLYVVKAQIHAGGRGKGGGIRVAASAAEVEQSAVALLGHHLVTPQTGPEGQIVQRVLVEEGCEIAQELYCGLVIDRQFGQPLCLVSPVGGMEIEAVATTSPDKIFREPIDVLLGLAPFQARSEVEQL